MLVAQSSLTLCDPMDCSLPDSSVRGILQARILEQVAMPSGHAKREGVSMSNIQYFKKKNFYPELLNFRKIKIEVFK